MFIKALKNHYFTALERIEFVVSIITFWHLQMVILRFDINGPEQLGLFFLNASEKAYREK